MGLTTRTRSWQHPWEELQALDYFGGLPLKLLKDAARATDRVDVGPGVRLQRAGLRVRWIYVVVAGVLRVQSTGELVVRGQAHGEADVLLGRPAADDLVAVTEATVLAVPAALFHGLLGSPEFAQGVIRRLVDTVAEAAPAAELVGAHR